MQEKKLFLDSVHSFAKNADGSAVVRSPAGDVDINILFPCVAFLNPENICIDYGNDSSRTMLQLSSIDMSNGLKKQIGFHSVT